jgi:hypothetical protein
MRRCRAAFPWNLSMPRIWITFPQASSRGVAAGARRLSGIVAVLAIVGAGSSATEAAPSGTAAPPPTPAAALMPLRDLDSHCPFTPPTSKAAWEKRAADLRDQVRVSLGLWPMPHLPPVAARIHGRLVLDGYTIDKVVFESLPGLFVTGNVYRPHPMPSGGRIPAVLCPHGHWPDARFQDVADDEVRRQLASGAERFVNAARNPYQARCVQLARMGCLVFQWDMLGYCDSTQISLERAHRFAEQDRATEVTDEGWLLYSPLAESHAQSVMGLQAIATIRSIDFVAGLSEVDPARIAITGASGGGTQSFITAAIDPRIAVAFPAVMVSTGMQGGCTCENACGLRVGTGNVEIAATIAPRPLGVTAANDWTRTMPEDGFPQLRQTFGLVGDADDVALFPAIHFDHNYNHVSRGAMYGWINRHLGLGLEEPVLERDFAWQGRTTLSVWDDEHRRPEGGEIFERRLLEAFRDRVTGQLLALRDGDPARFRATLETGWRVVLGMTSDGLSQAEATAEAAHVWRLEAAGMGSWSARLVDEPRGDVSFTISDTTDRHYAVAVCGECWDADGGLAAVDEQPLVANPRLSAAYTYGYNPPLFVRRCRQIAATAAWLQRAWPEAKVTIEGRRGGAALAAGAGLWLSTTEAAPVRVSIDPDGFRFENVTSIRDPWFLPGSARFLDLPGLVHCLPHTATIRGRDSADIAGLPPPETPQDHLP